MFLFQLASTSNGTGKTLAPDRTVGQRISDYINSSSKKQYTGVPKLTDVQSKELLSMSEAVWNKSGFQNMKLPPAVKEQFVKEFTTSTYVVSGIANFLSKNGPVDVKLSDGSELTISKDTLTPDMLERLVSFTALNAAIKGRVGTTKDAYLDDNIVLHTLLSLHNSGADASAFFTDKNGVDWAKLEKMRPTGTGTSKNLASLSTVLDGTALKAAYDNILKSVSGSGLAIHRQFIDKGYLPTTPGKTQGNVELVFLAHLLKAEGELSPQFVAPKKEGDGTKKEGDGNKQGDQTGKNEGDKQGDGTKKEGDGTKKEDGTKKDEGTEKEEETKTELKRSGKLGLDIDSRGFKMLRQGDKLTRDKLDKIPTEIGPIDPLIREPKALFNDIFDGAKSVRIYGGNGEEIKLTSFTYDSMKKLVDYFVDNTKGKDKGSFAAVLDNGKKYIITYDSKKDGDNHTFSIALSPPVNNQSVTSIGLPLVNITGGYSSTKSGEITLNKANIEVKTEGASFSGFGSYSYANNEIKDGNFGLKFDLADKETGRTAHLYLSGADINLVQGSFGKVDFNAEDPMISTLVVGDRTYTLREILQNKNNSWRAMKDAVGESFKGGYLSFDAGYSPFEVQMDKLDMKHFTTMKGLRLAAGETSIKFNDNEFNLNYSGQSGVLKDGFSLQWKANGEELVRVTMPGLTEEQNKNVTAALDAFTDRIASLDSKKENIYEGIRDAVSDLANTLTDRNDPKYKALLESTRVDINMANLLSSFEGGSFIGDLAKNGLAPSLKNDLPNHGKLSFSVAELGELARKISEGVNATDWNVKQERWHEVEEIVRQKAGLPPGQVFLDNTVMSMYFGDFNSQQEIVERALAEGSPALQLYVQNKTAGTSERNRIGIGTAIPLMTKDDFMLFTQGGVSLQELGVSVFGNMAEQSNSNYITKSVTIDAGLGAKVKSLNIDFGVYGSVNLPYQKIIEANNMAKNGGSFVIPLTEYESGKDTKFTHPEYRAYVFGKYSPLDGKVQFTVIAGLVPEYTYAGNYNSNMRFTAGGQIKIDRPFEINIGETTIAPDVEVIMPSFTGKSFYGKAGVSWSVPGSGFIKKFDLRAGVDGMTDGARTMFTPSITGTVDTKLIPGAKNTEFYTEYKPGALNSPLRFGTCIRW